MDYERQEDPRMKGKHKKHIVGVLLENEAGALSRVVGLFSQRGYNIESMTVAPTQDETLSRLTLTTHAVPEAMEQIVKQLNKIVPVYKVIELSEELSFLEREVLLIKVRAQGEYRAEVKRLADIFAAAIVDVTTSTYTVELTGRSKELDAFVRILEERHILELVRTGIAGMARGAKGFAIEKQGD